MIQLIYSRSVACEYEFVTIRAEILYKYRLRSENAFPAIGTFVIMELVYSITVIRDCCGVDIFSYPCSFDKLERVRSIELFDFFTGNGFQEFDRRVSVRIVSYCGDLVF